jgi:hypothetical protein
MEFGLEIFSRVSLKIGKVRRKQPKRHDGDSG